MSEQLEYLKNGIDELLFYELKGTPVESPESVQAKSDYIYANLKLGFGDPRAGVHEVAQIMREYRKLQPYCKADVYQGAVDASRTNSRGNLVEYLIDTAIRYAKLVQGGEFFDLDKKLGDEANTEEILGIIQKWEEYIASIAPKTGISSKVGRPRI